MNYNAIIITGTDCPERTAIIKKLCEKHGDFELLRLTTINPDDSMQILINYQYLKKDIFNEAIESNKFLLLFDYMEKKFGILSNEFDKIIENKKTPLLEISSPLLSKFRAEDGKVRFFTFFLDATNAVSDTRLSGECDEKSKRQQTNNDSYNELYLYRIMNNNIEDTAELIWAFWDFRTSSGILSKRLIELMIKCGTLLNNADLNKVTSAAYDLSLGDEYYHDGKIKKLTDKEPFIPIGPYDYAIVTSKEIANFPKDITARFDLSVSLFCQGIILSNGPQIDPGFEGRLFCLLFNTSNTLVTLKRAQHYATIEFHKLIEPTNTYVGKYQGKYKIVSYLPSNSMRGGLYELKKELDDIKRENKNLMSIFLGVTSLILAIIALILLVK